MEQFGEIVAGLVYIPRTIQGDISILDLSLTIITLMHRIVKFDLIALLDAIYGMHFLRFSNTFGITKLLKPLNSSLQLFSF